MLWACTRVLHQLALLRTSCEVRLTSRRLPLLSLPSLPVSTRVAAVRVTMDASIPDHVASSFADSEHQGFVHLYRATATHRVDRCPDGWTHWGHVVPQLVDKPAVPPK